MDPRRFLILAACGLGVSALPLSGCALWRGAPPPSTTASLPVAPTPVEAPALEVSDAPPAPDIVAAPTQATEPVEAATATAVPYERPHAQRPATARLSGREAIAAANRSARAASTADAFVGSVQVFAWSPGRVFEVWAAPLRVTTLTLGAGETLVSKAAGDTVRWQIGETTSGEGASARTHVMLKPLERGLETNLILTTSRRVYLLDLKSGSTDAFNAAVAWDETAAPLDAPDPGVEAAGAIRESGEIRVPDPVVLPQGELDGRYRIEPQGRRARWTPTAVFNDGVRTFIAFDPDLQVDEAPALFVLAPDGEAQMVNYRQAGGLFIVDRVFDRAELRLGDRRPQVVRIRHLSGGRS